MNRIQYLDGLRAISIIMVLIGHGANSFSDAKWLHFIGNSHLGVMIFFNISGFLITSLLLNEYAKKGGINIKQFYIRRGLRIFPVFYMYIITVFILVKVGILNLPNSDFFYASTYLWNYKAALDSTVSTSDIWYLGHFWTLALEEQFYLFWPLILYFIKPEKVMKFLPFLLISFPVIRFLSYFFAPDLRGQIGMMLHTMSDSILWGGYAAMLLFYKKDWVFDKLKILSNKFILGILLFFLFIGTNYLSILFKGSYSITIGFTLESISIGLFILYLVMYSPQYFAFLNNTYLVYLGVLSYSLYIWQQLFLAPSGTSLVFEFPFNFILTFGAAFVSYNTIERFGLYIKSKL